MWTVVYVAQKAQEIFRIVDILNKNEIISRVREGNDSDKEKGMCFEVMVPSAELSKAQDLIIAAEI